MIERATIASQTFDPETASVRSARSFVLDASEELSVDAEILGLLVSELVSNAVLHARCPFEVVVSSTGDAVRVAVRDDSTALPVVAPPDLTATAGRGLRIVDRLARAWGVDARGDGKDVWFELARAPAA